MKNLLTHTIQKILRILAHATIRKYQPGIIGITGSAGKTSTKNAVYHLLKDHRRVRAAKKNFNNELGLCLTILGDWDEIKGIAFWPVVFVSSLFRLMIRSRRYPELLILEYAADRPGDIRYLTDIARPTVACITAIGEIPAHVEFFTGPDAVAREKARLIEILPSAGCAILNADDEAVMNIRQKTRAKVITFGFAENADMRLSQFEHKIKDGIPRGILFKLEHNNKFVPIKINDVVGLPQAYVAAAAMGVGLIFGINLIKLAEHLETYTPANGRLKRIDGIKDSTIIDDTYNASPLSMKGALETIGEFRGTRTIVVLGDMLEIGKYTIEAHEAIGEAAAKIADIIITVGPRAKFIAEGAKKSGYNANCIFSFNTADEAKIHLQNILQEKDIVLIKGSQSMRMEKVVEEVMRNPEDAAVLLVRQSKWWKKTKVSLKN